MTGKHKLLIMCLVATLLSGVAITTSPAHASGSVATVNGARLLLAAVVVPAPAVQACTEFEVDETALWFVAVNRNKVDTDQVVDSYPTGTKILAAGFRYDCVPEDLSIEVVWYEGTPSDEPWNSYSGQLDATNRSGTYWANIYMTDGSAIQDGDYSVEFYEGDRLLTSGTITVGGEATPPKKKLTGDLLTIEGVVSDAATGKPVKVAFIVLLQPGLTAEDWLESSYGDEESLAQATTDSKGRFTLSAVLERETMYTLIAFSPIYLPYIDEDFSISAADEADPYELNIELTRQTTRPTAP